MDDNSLAAQEWSQAHLASPPPAQLDIGSRLDVPFVTGFYPAEKYADGDYRWSAAEATVEVGGGTADQQVVVRWSGWRPAGVATALVSVYWRVCAGDNAPVKTCPWIAGPQVALPPSDTWQEDTLPVPGGAEAIVPRERLRAGWALTRVSWACALIAWRRDDRPAA